MSFEKDVMLALSEKKNVILLLSGDLFVRNEKGLGKLGVGELVFGVIMSI